MRFGIKRGTNFSPPFNIVMSSTKGVKVPLKGRVYILSEEETCSIVIKIDLWWLSETFHQLAGAQRYFRSLIY